MGNKKYMFWIVYIGAMAAHIPLLCFIMNILALTQPCSIRTFRCMQGRIIRQGLFIAMAIAWFLKLL